MNTMVFWHGWGLDHSIWSSLITHLESRPVFATQLHVQALPGYAGTTAPVPYSAKKLIDALLAKLPESFTICAWSMGAILAMQAAHLYPNRVKRLILMSGTPCFVKKSDWPLGMEEDVLKGFAEKLKQDSAGTLKNFISLFNQHDIRSRQIGRAIKPISSAPSSVLEQGLHLLGEMDLRPISSLIMQPALLIHGENDSLMPVDAAKWLAQTLPRARLVVLPDVAHAPFLSEPIECASLISNFMYDKY